MPLEVTGLAPLLQVFDMRVAIRFYRGRTLHSVNLTLAKRPNTSPNAAQQQGGGGGGGGGLPQLPLP